MKRWIACLLVGVLLLPTMAFGTEMDLVEDAKQVIEQLMAGEVDAYYDRFTPEVQAQLPRDDMPLLGQQISSTGGGFVAFGTGYTIGTVAVIPMQMETLNLIGQVGYTEDGQIAGIGFVQDTTAAVVPPSEPAENEESVQVGPKALTGILTLPADTQEPVPAVVLVHGSGPQDRDETLENTKIFRDLAQGLSAQGIAVLRYDKRAYAIGAGAVESTPEELADFTVYEDTIEDAVAAVQLLREDSRIDPDRVFVLGHSQGGMLATRIQEAGANADGLIILAGTLRHLTALVADQLAAFDRPDVYAEEIELAKALPDMTEEEARGRTLIGANAYVLWEEAQHDLVAAAEANDAPMLILQGDQDQNVYADVDYPLWEAFAQEHPDKDIELMLYEGLGHMFTVEDAFSGDVLSDIAQWILAR